MSQIDLTLARAFIAALTGAADTVITWQTFDDSKKRADKRLARIRHACLDQVADELIGLNAVGAGVYVSVNETDHKGRSAENVVALRAVFLDVDGTRAVPQWWALPPAFLVHRDATHWHAYWLLKSGERIEDFDPAQVHLACHFESDTQVQDPSRVMRVPGFMHNKGEPLPLRFELMEAGKRYTLAEVVAAYPVNYETLPLKRQKIAARAGLCPEPIEERPARPPLRAATGDFARQDEAYRKWAAQKDTRASGANDNTKGQDTAAFTIACEGYGRWQAGIISSETLIYAVVEDYCSRCGWDNLGSEVERLCRSARSKTRQHSAVDLAARPAPAAPVAASAAAGFGGLPPPPPPSSETHEDEDGPAPLFDGIDLNVLGTRWALSPYGVSPVEVMADGSFIARTNKRVCGLPIWPVCAGSDVASGETWWKLAWKTPAGNLRDQWVSEYELKLGHALVHLPDGPVAKRQAENCAVYLTEARSCVRNAATEVTSRIGWCGVNGSRRWVFPGVGAYAGVAYIGGALPSHGTVAGWVTGLQYLAKLPDDDGFTALAVVCLSAAAPWSRLMGARNPIIGLMGPSSSGKGSAIDYGLALWADPDLMRLPASSTAKGIQDRAIQLPDLPIMLDELQQLTELHPHATADALYFLANGQRRVTSSRDRLASGGERRHGVGFYAAEAPVLPGQNLGVLYRVMELSGPPCPDEATAKALQAGSRHTGALAGPISEYLATKTVPEWIEHLHARAAALRDERTGLTGDDPESIALIEQGGSALAAITGLDLQLDSLIRWLCERVRSQRKSVVDRETQCLMQVMSTVLNQSWYDYHEDPSKAPDKREHINVQGRPLAWRSYNTDGSTKYLDVDSLHRELSQIFTAHGGEARVLRQWADRDWILTQPPHLKVRRKNAGRVVRFSDAAWVVFGSEVAQ